MAMVVSGRLPRLCYLQVVRELVASEAIEEVACCLPAGQRRLPFHDGCLEAILPPAPTQAPAEPAPVPPAPVAPAPAAVAPAPASDAALKSCLAFVHIPKAGDATLIEVEKGSFNGYCYQ